MFFWGCTICALGLGVQACGAAETPVRRVHALASSRHVLLAISRTHGPCSLPAALGQKKIPIVSCRVMQGLFNLGICGARMPKTLSASEGLGF